MEDLREMPRASCAETTASSFDKIIKRATTIRDVSITIRTQSRTIRDFLIGAPEDLKDCAEKCPTPPGNLALVYEILSDVLLILDQARLENIDTIEALGSK